MVTKQQLWNYIDENAKDYLHISHKIWEYAELSLQEYKSADLYKEELKKAGFTVKENLADIETAFCGIYTAKEGCSGNWEDLPHPIIGILGEFDALSGLGQKAGGTEKEPFINDLGEKGSNGHGCGHNMLGAAAFGAACAVKHYLENNKELEGTVIFYGCPGEEGGASKAFMAREKEWQHLDLALTWHPGDQNKIVTGTNNACTQVLYKFHGISAHAAGNPQMGRSALDAVELMNVGVQFLREHMDPEAFVHYAIIDGGGVSPNVVQSEASVLYMVRSRRVPDTLKLQDRVDLIAKGAALMTETEFDRIFVDGTADLVPNTTLEKVLQSNLEEVELPTYEPEEIGYAKAIFESYSGETKKDFLCQKVETFESNDHFSPGSTDVGDVSHQTPTAQFNAVTFPLNAPGHSWQNTSCAGSTLGEKGTIYAAKVLAGAAVDLWNQPELIEKAKEEFKERTKDTPYVCPIPENVKAYIV
ncbi:MAG: amidohydrolase [Lachnospiraceae bacterium]|nr:amidohydrolase [Lachnospiraceae bacterium]